MITKLRVVPVVALVMAGCQRSPEIPASDRVLGRVGTVSFPVSCDDEAAVMVERGVAVLHHMTYARAFSVA